MTLFLLIVAGVAIYFIFFANKTTEPGGRTAMDILKEKFINGEIDEDEYNRKKHVIEK